MISRASRTRVPYTSEQMYALVADIEVYPDFLPWCMALRIVKNALHRGEGFLFADMVVAFNVFRAQFRSKVTLNPNDKAIAAHYTEGPFETLQTKWRFIDVGNDECDIDFCINFKFSNPVLQSTAQLFVEQVFTRMTDAFIVRAQEIYSKDSNNFSSIKT